MTIATDTLTPATGLEGTAPPVRLAVEYWTVTMEEQASCGSCDATLATLRATVDDVGPLAARLGIDVELVPRNVATWEEAVQHAIVASPTIRAAGIELRPSHSEDSETRTWEWRGASTNSATPEAMLDLVIQALAVRSGQLADYLGQGGPSPYVRRFLRAAPTGRTVAAADASPSGCG